nr:FtsX-like permease family protein [Actinomyces sp.]
MTGAVFQRVGEFGLRRAIGARRVHVMGLVMVESLGVGLLGGVLGTYGAVLAVLGVTLARHWQPVLEPALLPLGVLGGAVVGVLGGLLATWKASRIEPADALRASR